MNKSKTNLSQTKIKAKMANISPINNKSGMKSKEKISRVSPRSNRINTLEPKKTN